MCGRHLSHFFGNSYCYQAVLSQCILTALWPVRSLNDPSWFCDICLCSFLFIYRVSILRLKENGLHVNVKRPRRTQIHVCAEVGRREWDRAVAIEDTCTETVKAAVRARELPVVCGVLQARLYGDCGWAVCPPPPSARAYVKEQRSRGKQELFIAQHCRSLTGGGRHVCVRAAESKGVSRQCA